MGTEELDDEAAYKLVRSALAANDNTFTYWPPKSVEFARGRWHQVQGEVPSLIAVKAHIGPERFNSLLREILDRRKFDNILKGYGSPCHYCGAKDDLTRWDFALMRVSETKREIGASLASVAISAIALPLIGAAAFKVPGKSLSGAAHHLRLVVCKPCCKKEGGVFGLFLLNEHRASRHPLWTPLHEAGFTKYLSREKMPESFRMDFGQYL